MQRCEIMLNDLIDSKRVNTNIKKASQTGLYFWNLLSFQFYNCYVDSYLNLTCVHPLCLDIELGESELSVDILTSTILSTNFWPPIHVVLYSSF